MSLFTTFRVWLGNLIAGYSSDELVGGIGYPGSLASVAGNLRKALKHSVPAIIKYSVIARQVKHLNWNEVRVIIEYNVDGSPKGERRTDYFDPIHPPPLPPSF